MAFGKSFEIWFDNVLHTDVIIDGGDGLSRLMLL